MCQGPYPTSVINYRADYFCQPTSTIRPKRPRAESTKGRNSTDAETICVPCTTLALIEVTVPCDNPCTKGDATFKSFYLYEYFPVQKKIAILSKRQILLAILLYEQFIHLTQVTLRPNIQFFSTQQRAYQSFWLLPGLIPFTSP